MRNLGWRLASALIALLIGLTLTIAMAGKLGESSALASLLRHQDLRAAEFTLPVG